ncbi:DUF922 domain-containing protein [Aurantibacter crassamenti]|uniref:DUF922 domain-containing protein n=1 Tax=Aurantibacter crassamenti TaxID=1837375 RepID=UPI00193A41B4|nr:DUF922 domain-containing protein [Aurantibacter crassamenti]MBM1107923.1 DUF922 domain-containing protein [Aurantibacter crassamenti]
MCILTFSQIEAQDEDRVLLWSKERKLTWADYQGSPLKTEWAAATTASGITYSLSSIIANGESSLEIIVNSLFYPDKSWYKPELCNDVVLSHEQLHFDITELFAKKFRTRLKTVRNDTNIKKKVRAIFVEINADLHAFQNKYDRETNYSRDLEQQSIWNEKIAKSLEE